ncbi:DNA/RNA non-specific endonuclease [Chryseobacterium phocaeense]|uniref:DNA/RNA non-specific endonuclease n=1 Tax=Chryseobacterium phocaeense TaxID=1816690 RepID=UPI0009BABA9A|nr:DNA/RNA non-specific endonuclease [Chryseobacterium phocaeense]
MDNPFSMQPELRYGAPVCDEILTGRYFTIGYSWYFRQAKWTLEIINRNNYLVGTVLEPVERLDNFRADIRIPKRFRAGLDEYAGSGYDRGHLVSSANQINRPIQNSETFLLSNMSPQKKELNRFMWKTLEEKVRVLNAKPEIFETYVLSSPVFYFNRPIETIGEPDDLGIDIPIPHAFVKSVLAEDNKGRLSLWTFLMENTKLEGKIEDYLVKTYNAEQLVGGRFWDRISGTDMHDQKRTITPIWDY